MAKKLLGVIVLMLAMACVLASCGHEHNWSEWETTTEATCTAEGSRIRNCTDEKCDESETETIYAKGHSFGQWVTTKQKTCTDNGIKERVCSCGEKETETIYCTGHISPCAWGCYACREGWVTINLPETPLILSHSERGFQITELSYRLGVDDYGKYSLSIDFSGEQIYGSGNPWFYIKILDSEGYVIYNHYKSYDLNLKTGEKIKDKEYTTYCRINFDPKETYTLLIYVE